MIRKVKYIVAQYNSSLLCYKVIPINFPWTKFTCNCINKRKAKSAGCIHLYLDIIRSVTRFAIVAVRATRNHGTEFGQWPEPLWQVSAVLIGPGSHSVAPLSSLPHSLSKLFTNLSFVLSVSYTLPMSVYLFRRQKWRGFSTFIFYAVRYFSSLEPG
jgi:hypothetical protein